MCDAIYPSRSPNINPFMLRAPAETSSLKLILEKDEIIKQLLSGKFIFWFRMTSVFQI